MMGLNRIRTSKAIAGALVLGLASSIWPFDGEPDRASANQINAVITNPVFSPTDVATFTAQIRCVGRINHPPFGVNLKIQTDQGTVYVPWFTPIWNLSEYAPDSTYNQQGFRDFEISWELSRQKMSALGLNEFQIDRVLYAKDWRVSASTTSCDNTDLTPDQVYNKYFSSQERPLDGPRVEFGAKSLSIRQGTAPVELASITRTFHGGFSSQRFGEESLFSVEPTCSVRDNEGEILTNTEIAQLESGESREIRCESGTLKTSEAWRSDSFVGRTLWGAGRLHIIGDSQWALAADHFSNFKDDLSFIDSKVPLVLPAGANDAVYVLSEHGEGPPNRQELSSMQIGGLVGSNGKSISADFCSVNHGSAIATSPTARIAVGAGMTGTGNYGDAEFVRFSFDENSAQCDFAFSDRVSSPIRSLVIEDADTVLALHGTASDTISRITFPDIVADPDAEFEPAPQQDFALEPNLQLQAIVTDSRGKLWGVSQLAGDVTIWELTLVPPVLNVVQPDPIFNDVSWSFHSFTIQDNDDQEQEPPVGTVTAEEWLTFDDDAELLVGFEARGTILTVSTWDNYSWSYFTSVRSFDSRNKSVVAQMQSNPGDDCDDFFGIQDSCGGYLLGVDAGNGAAILGDYGDLGRTGPATSGAPSQLSEAWTSFGSNSSNRGTLTNDGEHAWLFNSDDATFERVALAIPEVPNVTENTSVNSGAISFVGPMIEPIRSPVRVGSEIVLRGQRLGAISSLKIGEVTQTLTSKSETELRFKIEANTKLGVNDIVLVSSFGSMTFQSAIRIVGPGNQDPLATSVTNPPIGTTKMLSRSFANNQRWFKANLEDSDVGRILCTALVRANATEQQKRRARTLAQTTCSQAAAFLDAPKVNIRVRETTTAKMSGRVMIGFRN